MQTAHSPVRVRVSGGGISIAPLLSGCISQPSTKNDWRIHAMNWDRIEGNWKQFKGKAKQKWGELTDDDIDQLAGKKDQLVGKIQERKGIARDRAEREVNEWMDSL
jgi:uncharacterized protein YjbJ (UPF0337 family)